jgi:hypothetical protein
LTLAEVLADSLQAVEHRGAHHDGRAVLVVVEDRNLHPLAQLALDVETLRRLDVFQVDAAEGGLHAGDDVDQLVRVALVEFDVEHVDVRELLEQHGLAFHHRLGGERADGTEAQHRGAVGDDTDQIAARRQRADFKRDWRRFLRRRCHAGRIGQRQILLVGQCLGRHRPKSCPAWACGDSRARR